MYSDVLSSTFAALAHPARRAILAHLMSGEASVTELAEPFKMRLSTVARHLKVLENAGLITRTRAAQWRPRRIQADPLKEVADWVENYRMAWEGKLDHLHDYLLDLRAPEWKPKEKKNGRDDR
ncbi:MAG: ArsR/SmtB family transcription factor [Candidatus Acidiferrales bacterium]